MFPLSCLICGPASGLRKGALSCVQVLVWALDTVIEKVGSTGSGPPLLCGADLSREHRCGVGIGDMALVQCHRLA